jgi:DNA-binding response OmpR family regulator
MSDYSNKKSFPLIEVVEDNDFMTRILMDCLKGYNCFNAKTKKDAMELFEEKKPDIVFLDLVLPDGHSLDLIPQMIAKKSNVAIVIVSGEDQKDFLGKSISLGAKFYIQKPYSKAQIELCLKRFLEENRSE